MFCIVVLEFSFDRLCVLIWQNCVVPEARTPDQYMHRYKDVFFGSNKNLCEPVWPSGKALGW